jgi:hypothetical protein
MTQQITHSCEAHPDPADCSDALVGFIAATGEYGIRIHDGGSSYLVIRYCPWCGADLSARHGADGKLRQCPDRHQCNCTDQRQLDRTDARQPGRTDTRETSCTDTRQSNRTDVRRSDCTYLFCWTCDVTNAGRVLANVSSSANAASNSSFVYGLKGSASTESRICW